MGQMSRVSKNNTTVAGGSHSGGCVTLHRTDVVFWNFAVISLNTGGWATVTTKSRMNQASNQFDLGYRVYAKGYQWYVTYRGNTEPFDRRATLDRQSGKIFTDMTTTQKGASR